MSECKKHVTPARALAMDLRISWINPSIYSQGIFAQIIVNTVLFTVPAGAPFTNMV